MAKAFLFDFFHNETNDRTERGLVRIPKDIRDWPEDWKKVEYKQYQLFPPIELPRLNSPLLDLLSKRRPRESDGYVLANNVTEESLGNMLRSGCGLRDYEGNDPMLHEKRTAPSAGGRYPLELYPVLFKSIAGIRAGIYHYGIREHVLEPVTFSGFTHEEIESSVYQGSLADATGMICISAVFDRSIRKYGSRGYRYILLEAGHVAQNIILAGVESGIDILPVGGANEVDFERRIGLMSSNERIVYILFF